MSTVSKCLLRNQKVIVMKPDIHAESTPSFRNGPPRNKKIQCLKSLDIITSPRNISFVVPFRKTLHTITSGSVYHADPVLATNNNRDRKNPGDQYIAGLPHMHMHFFQGHQHLFTY